MSSDDHNQPDWSQVHLSDEFTWADAISTNGRPFKIGTPKITASSTTDSPSSTAGSLEVTTDSITINNPFNKSPFDIKHQQKRWLLGAVPLAFNGDNFKEKGSSPGLLREVKAFSDLLILRRHFLNFSPRALTLIMESMPSLESLRYERWRYGELEDEERRNRAQHLGHLSVAFSLSGVKLLWDMTLHSFRALETIALTSKTLLSRHRVLIDDLLLWAAAAARNMPKLKIMELWCYMPSTIAIFRYERLGRYFGVITWEGYVQYHITAKVVAGWRHVLPQDVENPSELLFENVPLLPSETFSLGSMYEHLKLREYVLHESTWAEVKI
ncbi:Oxoglutarate iron-dependent oxygenase [Fusarium heterosporum]|uniref:Oxoglutarate iron-dependent oxygenase n=1 Tax=Fusarium heterosporum TaxID=42747 RepID=A0A8H5WZN0_FUSHE|nr:Oxoglutarate iron-dependent oxygenase [Fusarium heterosporum]